MKTLLNSLFQYYTISELTMLIEVYDNALYTYNYSRPVNREPEPELENHIERMNEIWLVRDFKIKENSNTNVST